MDDGRFDAWTRRRFGRVAGGLLATLAGLASVRGRSPSPASRARGAARTASAAASTASKERAVRARRADQAAFARKPWRAWRRASAPCLSPARRIARRARTAPPTVAASRPRAKTRRRRLSVALRPSPRLSAISLRIRVIRRGGARPLARCTSVPHLPPRRRRGVTLRRNGEPRRVNAGRAYGRRATHERGSLRAVRALGPARMARGSSTTDGWWRNPG